MSDGMKFKKGDRVLVPGVVTSDRPGLVEVHLDGTPDGTTERVTNAGLQLDPGVTIADLVEEIELAEWIAVRIEEGQGGRARHPRFYESVQRLGHLRAAREAANKPEPQFTEGQEVWVRGTISSKDGNGQTFVYFGLPGPTPVNPTRIRPVGENDK